jgi:hypothetical protein
VALALAEDWIDETATRLAHELRNPPTTEGQDDDGNSD